MMTLTDAQVGTFNTALGDIHLSNESSIERIMGITFADDETSFSSCSYFQDEEVMVFYEKLPPRTKSRLDRACSARTLQPGLIKELMERSKAKYGDGSYRKAVVAFDFLENHLIVAEALKDGLHEEAPVDWYAMVNCMPHVIAGVIARRVFVEKKQVSGRLSPDEAKFAATTVYLIATETSGSHHLSVDLLRTHPEKVFGIVEKVLEQAEVDS